jgi:hypothetical protein
MALYMLGFVSYGATLVFFAALFPRLARNTPRTRHLREEVARGNITPEEFEREESLEKNRISNISTMHSNWGYLFTLCLNLSVLLPLQQNPLVDQYAILLTNAYWVILGIWWCMSPFMCLFLPSFDAYIVIFQAPRPGPPVPKGSSYLTIGWKQIYEAVSQFRRLPYTFMYLLAFFLLADVSPDSSHFLEEHDERTKQGLNTTGTLISIVQNE